jgi:hypothetical protein
MYVCVCMYIYIYIYVYVYIYIYVYVCVYVYIYISACLLGAPLSTGKAMDFTLTAKCDSLDRVMGRLSLLSSQDALFILRAATGSQIILSVLRAAPCTDHPALVRFDATLRGGLSSILNCEISGLSWTQANLPICDVGLGVRSVVMLAPSAFLASAAATLPLQEAILPADPLVSKIWFSGSRMMMN